MKLKNTAITLHDLGYDDVFVLHTTFKAAATKEKDGHMKIHQNFKVSSSKTSHWREKLQLLYIKNNRLVSRIHRHKEFIKQ